MNHHGEKFLNNEELAAMSEKWKRASNLYENPKPLPHYGYKANRTESEEPDFDSIREIHELSFIDEVIPKLLSKKNNTETVCVLDIGAGTALYADQIRKTFPSRVKVYSTGLSKQAARARREQVDPGSKLHKDDLKWRSIRQMGDYEEFDLIIDTYGEQFYTADATSSAEVMAEIEKYLEAVIKKLKPGGLASIAPLYRGKMTQVQINNLLEKLKNNFDIHVMYSFSDKDILRIEKLQPNARQD